ncbi:MAG: TetR/AcrR family transcriptional regulator [Polyangiaceae bacterium]|nr:TetR/AcrR family transcriptional regulator [Polyangiaceae bacterium]MCB9605545.1 TetR/AcrR family transcriptional regulator [Polyangiaceae bacterium]
MPRPVDADSAATFDRIVRAALEVLEETVPRSSMSMRQVAERAGVSVGTLNYYFETKERLLEACLDGYYQDLATTAQRLLSGLANGPVPAGEPAIRSAVADMYRFITRHRALIELRLVTNAMRGELAPERQHEFMGTVIQQAADVLSPHVEIDRDELRLTIQLLATSIIRMALLSPSERAALTGRDDDSAIAEFVERAAVRLVRPKAAAR